MERSRGFDDGGRDEMYWYNFDTGEYEYRAAPAAKDEWLPYINDWPGARNLFLLLVEHRGMTPVDAAVDVMSRMVGDILTED